MDEIKLTKKLSYRALHSAVKDFEAWKLRPENSNGTSALALTYWAILTYEFIDYLRHWLESERGKYD